MVTLYQCKLVYSYLKINTKTRFVRIYFIDLHHY